MITEGLFAGKEVGVKGLPWCREQYKFIPIETYTANILCTRHNSDLSPVDDVAILAFNNLRMIIKVHEERKALVQERMWAGRFDVYDYDIDGAMFERWFLKTLINMESVGGQKLSIGQPGGTTSEFAQTAFGTRSFRSRAGLYFIGQEQQVIKISQRITYIALIKDSGRSEFIAASEFFFYGLRFILCLEEAGLPPSIRASGGEMKLIHHVRSINLDLNGQPSQRLHLRWPEKTLTTGVR